MAITRVQFYGLETVETKESEIIECLKKCELDLHSEAIIVMFIRSGVTITSGNAYKNYCVVEISAPGLIFAGIKESLKNLFGKTDNIIFVYDNRLFY